MGLFGREKKESDSDKYYRALGEREKEAKKRLAEDKLESFETIAKALGDDLVNNASMYHLEILYRLSHAIHVLAKERESERKGQ